MTREEAINKCINATRATGSMRDTTSIKNDLVILEALGLIKFEEATYQQFAEVNDINGNVQKVKLRDMISMLIASGYKVEKLK